MPTLLEASDQDCDSTATLSDDGNEEGHLWDPNKGVPQPEKPVRVLVSLPAFIDAIETVFEQRKYLTGVSLLLHFSTPGACFVYERLGAARSKRVLFTFHVG